MVKVTFAGLILLLTLNCGGAAEAAVCTDEHGNPVPCEQDPGGGGSGGDPCSISQAGYCEYQTIYPNDYECTAGWCAPEPAAMLKCASFISRTCQDGTDAEGNPIMSEINDCQYCPD